MAATNKSRVPRPSRPACSPPIPSLSRATTSQLYSVLVPEPIIADLLWRQTARQPASPPARPPAPIRGTLLPAATANRSSRTSTGTVSTQVFAVGSGRRPQQEQLNPPTCMGLDLHRCTGFQLLAALGYAAAAGHSPSPLLEVESQPVQLCLYYVVPQCSLLPAGPRSHCVRLQLVLGSPRCTNLASCRPTPCLIRLPGTTFPTGHDPLSLAAVVRLVSLTGWRL